MATVLHRFSLMLLALSLSGCASWYFDRAQAPTGETRYTLDTLPFQEYWSGIVFNGEKVGFQHLTIRAAENGQFTLESRAQLQFAFLGFDKTVTLHAVDTVNPDLSLQRFRYHYHLDGTELLLTGERADDALQVELQNRDQHKTLRFPLVAELFPTSAIYLKPLAEGLAIGKHYRYQVFDGETQQLAEVSQDVVDFERSELFEGAGYKLLTRLYGHEVTAWLDTQGLPLLELSLNGALIAGLESEQRARHYLLEGSVNKREGLLELSLIPVDAPLESPRSIAPRTVQLLFTGTPGTLDNPQCEPLANGYRCQLSPYFEQAEPPADALRQPNWRINSYDPRIIAVAEAARFHSNDPGEQIQHLIDWMDANIGKAAADVFSASDVLELGRAECQGHALLFAALARALNIPTRVVNGIVYSEQHQGFLYHTWNESWVNNRWQAVDPTFGEATANSTHLRISMGEDPAASTVLLQWIGRVERIRSDVRHQTQITTPITPTPRVQARVLAAEFGE